MLAIVHSPSNTPPSGSVQRNSVRRFGPNSSNLPKIKSCAGSPYFRCPVKVKTNCAPITSVSPYPSPSKYMSCESSSLLDGDVYGVLSHDMYLDGGGFVVKDDI